MTRAFVRGRGGYQGAQWPKVTRGRCSKHQEPVPAGSVCYRCHLEQMAAAGHDRESALLADLDRYGA